MKLACVMTLVLYMTLGADDIVARGWLEGTTADIICAVFIACAIIVCSSSI